MDITGLDTILMKHVRSVLTECVDLYCNSVSGNGTFTKFNMSFNINPSINIDHKKSEQIEELTQSDSVYIYLDYNENGFAHYQLIIEYKKETLIKYLDE